MANTKSAKKATRKIERRTAVEMAGEELCRPCRRVDHGDVPRRLGAHDQLVRRARGELDVAVDSFNKALGHYDSEKIALPPELAVGQQRGRRLGDDDHGRALRCRPAAGRLHAVPPGGDGGGDRRPVRKRGVVA